MNSNLILDLAFAEPSVDRLIRFIESHPPALCHGSPEPGYLAVSTEYVTGSIVSRVEETIPATLASVREWLGY